jgi:hypothetical protein
MGANFDITKVLSGNLWKKQEKPEICGKGCLPFPLFFIYFRTMSLPIPNIEPAVITAGDTITWSRSLPDYPASSGWVLHYALRGVAAVIDITGTASGNDHLISILAATSAAYVAGQYSIQGYVINGSTRVTIFNDTITITPDLVTAVAGYDGRSHVKKTLDSLEAVIEGRASRDQLELTIDGTRLVKMTPEQILAWRAQYHREYRKELQAARIAQGKNSGRKIVTRFTR